MLWGGLVTPETVVVAVTIFLAAWGALRLIGLSLVNSAVAAAAVCTAAVAVMGYYTTAGASGGGRPVTELLTADWLKRAGWVASTAVSAGLPAYLLFKMGLKYSVHVSIAGGLAAAASVAVAAVVFGWGR